MRAIGSQRLRNIAPEPGAGKGLDGVVRRAPGYDNPATTLLETGESK